MNGLVVTPCGRRKAPAPTQAADLYRGSYFRVCLRYARHLQPDNRIRILSALHGLVYLDQVLAPYNVMFGGPGTIRVAQIREQAAQQGLLDANPVIILGGVEYASRALPVWPHATTPPDHGRGPHGRPAERDALLDG